MSAVNIVKWRQGAFEKEGSDRYDVTVGDGRPPYRHVGLLRVLWILWRLKT